MNHRRSISVATPLAALTLGLGLIIAMPRAEAHQAPTPGQNVTLVGCLVESQTVSGLFLVANAVPKGSVGKGTTYRLVAAMEDPDFQGRRNHRIEVTGAPEPAKSTTSQADDRLLPAFTVKSLIDVSGTCSTDK